MDSVLTFKALLSFMKRKNIEKQQRFGSVNLLELAGIYTQCGD
jgi:hypothetical protein